jgi:hypothetical protein
VCRQSVGSGSVRAFALHHEKKISRIRSGFILHQGSILSTSPVPVMTGALSAGWVIKAISMKIRIAMRDTVSSIDVIANHRFLPYTKGNRQAYRVIICSQAVTMIDNYERSFSDSDPRRWNHAHWIVLTTDSDNSQT